MDGHRAVRRLGTALLAALALLMLPLVVLVNSPRAEAAPAPSVSGNAVCSGAPNYQWVVTWSITIDDPPAGSTVSWTANQLAPVSASWDSTSGTSSKSIHETLPSGYSGIAGLTVDVDYVDGEGTHDTGTSGPKTVNVGTCAAPPPTTNPPTTTRPPTTRPATTRPATNNQPPPPPPTTVVTTVAATSATPSETDVLIVATDSTRPVASGSGGGRPSWLLLLATFMIFLAFLIALIFLIRERRALKRERDDEEDGYWDEYRGAGYR